MKTVLTIGGSDCTGGSGIQADLKTFTAHKTYGMSAITGLVAQNTTNVFDKEAVDPDFLSTQLTTILEDVTPDAVKVGLIPNKELVTVIANKLKEYSIRNIVVDPVMTSSSGAKLAEYDVVTSLITQLMPISAVITPNMAEAKILCGKEVKTKDDMLAAAEKIQEIVFVPIMIKGGGLTDSADDLLYYGGEIYWFNGPKIPGNTTYGAGCTLAAAIAAQLAQENTLEASIRAAKVYLSGAIHSGLDIGSGTGPVNHCWNM